MSETIQARKGGSEIIKELKDMGSGAENSMWTMITWKTSYKYRNFSPTSEYSDWGPPVWDLKAVFQPVTQGDSVLAAIYVSYFKKHKLCYNKNAKIALDMKELD